MADAIFGTEVFPVGHTHPVIVLELQGHDENITHILPHRPGAGVINEIGIFGLGFDGFFQGSDFAKPHHVGLTQ